jgi:hypothetical protein
MLPLACRKEKRGMRAADITSAIGIPTQTMWVRIAIAVIDQGEGAR